MHKSATGTAEKQDTDRGNSPPRDPAVPEGEGPSPAPRGVPDCWMTDHAGKMTTRFCSLQKLPGAAAHALPSPCTASRGGQRSRTALKLLCPRPLRRPRSRLSFQNPHLGGRPAQTYRSWPSAQGPGPAQEPDLRAWPKTTWNPTKSWRKTLTADTFSKGSRWTKGQMAPKVIPGPEGVWEGIARNPHTATALSEGCPREKLLMLSLPVISSA